MSFGQGGCYLGLGGIFFVCLRALCVCLLLVFFFPLFFPETADIASFVSEGSDSQKAFDTCCDSGHVGSKCSCDGLNKTQLKLANRY